MIDICTRAVGFSEAHPPLRRRVPQILSYPKFDGGLATSSVPGRVARRTTWPCGYCRRFCSSITSTVTVHRDDSQDADTDILEH